MITAQELRIGNWVTGEFHNGKRPSQIFRIDETDNCEGIEGIPLTPEILERARFEKKLLGDATCYSLPYSRHRLTGDKEQEIILVDYGLVDDKLERTFAFAIHEFDRDIQFGISTVKYLHELQNGFHFLCGTELDINL
jgi:hypothetical protein